MTTKEKRLVDKGLIVLRGHARMGKTGDVSAKATPLEGAPIKGQGVRDIGTD